MLDVHVTSMQYNEIADYRSIPAIDKWIIIGFALLSLPRATYMYISHTMTSVPPVSQGKENVTVPSAN